MTTTAISLFAKEEAELEAHERLMDGASSLIREQVVVFGRELAKIHEDNLWKCRYGSFDDYCQRRWRFTGARGRQLVDAYDVAKNLASMTEDGGLSLYFFQYFSESHARILKPLEPEQQRQAVAAAVATGEKPTARVLQRVVDEYKATPENLDRMTREEQQDVIARMEEAATNAYAEQAAVTVLTLAAKRLRSVSEQARDEKFAGLFRQGEYHVTDGVCGLLGVLQEEVRILRERLAAPMLNSGA